MKHPRHPGLFVKSYAVTAASVRGSRVLDELPDQTKEPDGNKRTGYADNAYRSQDQE